jgi:hypothetical protein
MFIRYAKPCDATYLASLAEETLRETVASINAAEDMYPYCYASYGEAVRSDEIEAHMWSPWSVGRAAGCQGISRDFVSQSPGIGKVLHKS